MTWRDVVVRAQSLGVFEPELIILEMVRLRIPLPPDRLAPWAIKEFDHLDLPYTRCDMEIAIDSCLDKGWLRMLTARQVRREPPRYSTYKRYAPTSAGLLDFTEYGHCLVRRVFGEDHIRPA